MAASCWRSRNSRWLFSIDSRTSSEILSFTSVSARWSRVHSMSTVSRASTSGVSSSSRLRSVDRYGAQPAVSASADGSSIAFTVSTICQASRFCSTATTSFLYSAASSRARSVGAGESIGSASTQSAAPGPVTPDPISARPPVRSTAAAAPPRNRPTFSTVATTPYDA